MKKIIQIVWENKSNGQRAVTIPRSSGIGTGTLVEIRRAKDQDVPEQFESETITKEDEQDNGTGQNVRSSIHRRNLNNGIPKDGSTNSGLRDRIIRRYDTAN